MKTRLLYLFVLFIPLEQLLNFIFGIQTEYKIYRVLLFISIIIFFFQKVSSKSKFSRNFETKYFVIILFLGLLIGTIRILYGFGRWDYLTNAFYLYVIGILIFLIVSDAQTLKQLNIIANMLFIGVLISSFYGFILFIKNPLYYRLSGLFNNANHLAFAINIITPYLIYKLVNEAKKVYKTAYIISIIILTGIIFFTGSRTGVIVQIINFSYFLFFGEKKMKYIVSIVLIALIVGILSKSVFIEHSVLLDRFSKNNIETGSGRFDIANAALKLGLDNYFIGVGMGQYRFYHKEYISPNAYITVTKFDLGTHNHFLDLLVNYGIIALILYLIMIFKMFSIIKKINVSKEIKGLLFISFIGFNIFTLSQESLGLPLFWLYFGLLVALIRILNIHKKNNYEKKRSYHLNNYTYV